MMHLRILLHFQAPMTSAKIVERYGKPTHPLVIPMRFRKGHGLTHLALIP
jgi:hypothetical protein